MSGTPSLGQYIKFQAAVLQQLPRPNEFTPEVLDGWILNQASLARVLRETLVPAMDAKGVQTYAVSVDYSLSIEEMVRAGRYDWSNESITSKNFPRLQSWGKREVEVELVHLDRYMRNGDGVIRELDKRGYRPATLPELLALGAQYPDLQRTYSIPAFGSVWQDPDGDRYVAYLDGRASNRGLDLDWLEDGWRLYWCFAAVRK